MRCAAPARLVGMLLLSMLLLSLSTSAMAAPGDSRAPSRSSVRLSGQIKQLERTVWLLPTRGPASLGKAKHSLDVLLSDTLQDLDIDLDGVETRRALPDAQSLDALAVEVGKVVMLLTLHVIENDPEHDVELSLVAARPASQVLFSRIERVAELELMTRTTAMVRDLMRAVFAVAAGGQPRPAHGPISSPVHSSGRAILAVSGTLYGGFVGLSLQRASGSEDPRLLYPLLGSGAAVGLGAALVVADEWSLSAGDAGYLAAGMWWPAVAGHLLYEGRFADDRAASEQDAWSFGLVASTAGLTLSAVGLTSGNIGAEGAMLAHSGAVLGMLTGALTEIAVTGDSQELPHAGLGYGALGGLMLGSAAAINIRPRIGTMLAIDVGIVLGGLAGASGASALIFDEATVEKTQIWVAITGASMVGGGVFAALLYADDDSDPAEPEPEAMGPLGIRIASIEPAIVSFAPMRDASFAAQAAEHRGSGVGVRMFGTLW